MSEEAEPMNGEGEAAPPEQSSDTAPPASADTTPPPPENPYADEKEWGEDITPDKDGGLFKRILKEGSGGESPMVDDKVYVHYTGRLLDGTVFDSSLDHDEPFNFTLGQGSVIKGWDAGVATMIKGEKSLLTCKPEYGYGDKGSPPKIPGNAMLQFEIELLSWQGDDILRNGGVMMSTLKKGSDKDYYRPREGAQVEVQLLGKYDSKVFDDRKIKFPVGEGCEHNVVEGIEEAVKKMRKLQQTRLQIAPKYGWGHEGNQEFGIPPDATVTYEVTLLDYVKLKESWEYDTVEEKKTDAEGLKERGNTFFKAKKFTLALKQYDRAADLVSDNSTAKDEEKELIAPTYRLIQLNIAAVHLQMKNYEKAREACDKVLEKDDKNTKAFYRRGQAYFGMQEFEIAEKDFQEVTKLEPTNKAAQQRATECTNRVKALKEKEKRMYRTMFAKYAEQEEKDKQAEESAKKSAEQATAKTDEKKEDTTTKEDKTSEDAKED